MRVNQDFEELFELLNQKEVRYLLIGGYAYAIYAEPRYTQDMLDAKNLKKSGT